jgi:hypothetical protein
MATREIYDVPADEVEKYIRLFRENGATDVKEIPQVDGRFTLIITYPDFESHEAYITRMRDKGD